MSLVPVGVHLGGEVSLLTKSGIRYKGTLFRKEDDESSTLELANGINLVIAEFRSHVSFWNLFSEHGQRSTWTWLFYYKDEQCYCVIILHNFNTCFSHHCAISVRIFGTEDRQTDNSVVANEEVIEFMLIKKCDVSSISHSKEPCDAETTMHQQSTYNYITPFSCYHMTFYFILTFLVLQKFDSHRTWGTTKAAQANNTWWKSKRDSSRWWTSCEFSNWLSYPTHIGSK